MELLQIVGLDQFHCIGGSCSYTCCREWDIFIDEKSAQQYEKWGYQSCLDKRENGTYIRMSDKGTCPLLDENGLCNLVIKHGENSLCSLCARFPRLYDKLGNNVEYSLSNACPEVLRLLRERDWGKKNILNRHLHGLAQFLLIKLRKRGMSMQRFVRVKSSFMKISW